MFYSCLGLTSLSVSNFDTSEALDMYSMFRNLQKITSLDISNFKTNNCVDMGNMFNDCKNLEKLKINPDKFITSNVEDMR